MGYDNAGVEVMAAERLDFEAEADRRAGWLRDYAEAHGRKCFVLGLSGGKDSALVGWLAKRSGLPLVTLYLGCGSCSEDLDAARTVRDWLAPDHYFELDLGDALAGFAESMLWLDPGVEKDCIAVGNVKARLRMAALYDTARTWGGLVLGTGNASEAALGYFTKYGDGGYDMNPVADLPWSGVRAMVRWAGVPGAILDRPSSAGLWEGQTDEDELGLAYADVDAYLLGLPVDDAVAALIRERQRCYAGKGTVLNYGQ